MGLSEPATGRSRGPLRRWIAARGAPRWTLGLCLVSLAAAGQEPAPRPEVPSTAPSRAEEVIQALGDPGTSSEAVAALLQEAFDLFLVRIEVKDGPGAVGLARAMHGRAPAPWSAFCLEGALRRSSTADPRGESALLAYVEADGVLTALLRSEALGEEEKLAVTQRRAILAAGFDDDAGERASLGRALAQGGIDGAQILGLRALEAGDFRESARLFGLLLDRGEAAEDCPWALRGHGLAALESVRKGP